MNQIALLQDMAPLRLVEFSRFFRTGMAIAFDKLYALRHTEVAVACGTFHVDGLEPKI